MTEIPQMMQGGLLFRFLLLALFLVVPISGAISIYEAWRNKR